jgi:hypothetical protein
MGVLDSESILRLRLRTVRASSRLGNLTPDGWSAKAVGTVTHARGAASTILIVVLALVIASLGLDVTICFARDHVATDPLGRDHHVTLPTAGPLFNTTLGTEASAHGPCTDGAFSGAKELPNRPEIVVGAAAHVPVLPLAARSDSPSGGSLAELFPPTSRSTVLRQ